MSFHEYLIPAVSIAIPFIVLFIGRRFARGDKKSTQLQDITDFISANKGRIVELENQHTKLEERIRHNENEIARLHGRLNNTNHA